MVIESLPEVLHGSTERLLRILRCPECREGSLRADSQEQLRCGLCHQAYPVIDGVPFLFEAAAVASFVEADLARGPRPARRPHPAGGAYHWREYRIDEFLPPSSSHPRILLVGCGDSGERPYLTELGFEVVGFDIRRSGGTDFLADAHRLPLQDGTFDVVLSMQVLEHLHSPWLAVEEIARVLRPGGWFVGSVAFLKPFHNSYFHMSHLGVMELLQRAGLETDRLAGAQSLTYTMYGEMLPLVSRPVRRTVLGAVDRGLRGARALAWSLRRRMSADEPTDRFDVGIPVSFRTFDHLRHAPAVVFRARKPEALA